MQTSFTVPVGRLEVCHYKVPTDSPESDGTLQWDHNNITIVTAHAEEKQGIGYTYGRGPVAELIRETLQEVVQGKDALGPDSIHMAMWHRIRNLGRPGICSMAISAVDCALWDLKARLLGIPLVKLLGPVREAATVYGSGGFTSYSDRQLADQLGRWAGEGMGAVKMKIGRDPRRDKDRVHVARQAIGPDTKLYVDANGAYIPRQALTQARMLSEFDVRWFEEPVSSDDHEGLRFVRERVPPEMNVAVGEYGYEPFWFRRVLQTGSVDVMQVDITRCGGVTTFLQVAALCQAWNIPLSSHTAPTMHTHVVCATIPFTEMEYFHDHIRVERMFFEGLPELVRGELRPDLSRPGNGLELKRRDAEKFAA